ncbi:uncharacterized protein LOC124707804 isoform X2 [Lolium rigidum]|uniref:uncharacterized protein LOC124707804 isoform X2 n=1 Tax=Lolium rigidum TaxID=89674 RepID=UPI001F5D3398|nr:uncharacterized protein LOC124707804 isoform X2 [Lolium rigidum]
MVFPISLELKRTHEVAGLQHDYFVVSCTLWSKEGLELRMQALLLVQVTGCSVLISCGFCSKYLEHIRYLGQCKIIRFNTLLDYQVVCPPTPPTRDIGEQ